MHATLAPTTRRAAACVATLALLVAGLLALPDRPALASARAAATPQAAVRTAGALPSAVVTGSSACTGSGTVSCELWAKPGSLALAGATVPIWGLADSSGGPAGTPGPVLVVSTGDDVTLTVHNGLPDALAMTVPGLVGADGDDTTGAAAGADATLHFVASAPGTYLYEAGHTAMGARQVAMGLVGALIVRPAGFDSLSPTLDGTAATAFDDEAVLVLSEVDPALNANPATFNMKLFHPSHRLINGLEFPNTTPIATDHGRRSLLRYVNAGALGHSMGVLGAKERVLAIDARPDGDRPLLVSDMVAAGETEDVRVAFPAGGADALAVYETAGSLDNAGQAVAGTRLVGFGGMMTFLQAGAVTPPGDQVGPTVTGVSVSPNPATPAAPATVTATASDVNTGGSNVTQAEFVIDSQNVALGSGTPMTGAFGSPTVAVSGTITTGVLSTLTQGTHTVYVRALDSAGKWGAVSSATFKVGNTGPSATALSLSPNPVNTGSVQLSATGDDSSIGGQVVAGEYFIDTQGANGSGAAVTVATPGTVAAGTATIGAPTVAGLAAGSHTVYVHFQDDSNLWGPTATIALRIDRTPPALGASGNQVTPNPTDGVTGDPVDPTSLKVHATFVDSASNVVAAEGFLETPGTDGTGVVFLADDGSWSSPTEAGYGLIPLSQLTGLADGTHTVYVHGKDAAGNWGPLAPLTFVIDRGPKVTANTGLSFGVLAGPQTIATATSLGGIVAAEMFQGTDPGVGNASQLVVTPVGGTSVGLAAEPRSIGVGSRNLWVRAQATNGTWSPAVLVRVTVTGLFGDGFESGNTSAWSSTNGNQRWAVLKAAAIDGTWGLRATASGGQTTYVRANTSTTTSLTMAVKFRPGTLTTGTSTNTNTVTLMQAYNGNNGQLVGVQYRNAGANVRQVRLVLGNPNGGQNQGTWVQVGTGVTELRVDRASNGLATLSINGVAVSGSVSTGTTSANNFRIGIVAANGNGNSGDVHLDSFGATN